MLTTRHHRLVGEQEVAAAAARAGRRSGRRGRSACPRRAAPSAASSAATSSAIDLSPLAALRRLSIWVSTVSRSARASSISRMRRCSSGSAGRARRRRRRPAARRRWRRPRGCRPRNRLPRPSPLLAPSTSPPMSTNCTAAGTTFLRLAHRGERVEAVVGHLGHADVGVGGGERVGRGQRAAARRARCTATTCRRWADRRSRTVPWAARLSGVRRMPCDRCRWTPSRPSSAIVLPARPVRWPSAARSQAFAHARGRRSCASSADGRARRAATPTGTLDGARRASARSTGEVIAEALDGKVADVPGRARGARPRSRSARAPSSGPRSKGDCHIHSTWSDGGASIEAMARAAMAPRPRVHGAHRPLAPPHHRPRPQPRAAARRSSTRSPRSTSSWRRSAS